MPRSSVWAVAILAVGCAACSRTASDLAWYLPSGARAAAVVRLDRLRSAKSASAWLALLPPSDALRQASIALVASDGREWLIAARLPSSEVALLGSDPMTAAASAQFRTRQSGVPRLLTSERDAPVADVQIALSGDLELPLRGNLANLNRLLRMTHFTYLALRFGKEIEIEARGVCRSDPDAAELEQTVRALLLLAGKAGPQAPRIARDDRTVRIQTAVAPADASRLLPGF